MSARVTRVSPDGRDWIAAWEGGYRLKAYLCPAGVWTISAGVTRYSDHANSRVKQGDELSNRQEAVALFERVLRHYEAGVDGLTRDDLAQPEFDALVSFAYNLGVGALGSSTLVRVVNERRPADQVAAQLLRWRFADTDPKHPGLEEVEGLRRRRLAEAQVYAGGAYLDDDEMASQLAKASA